MPRKPKFKPVITRVKLDPEQAVLSCNCYGTVTTVVVQAWHFDQFIGGGGICVWNGRSHANFGHMSGVHWGYGLGTNLGTS